MLLVANAAQNIAGVSEFATDAKKIVNWNFDDSFNRKEWEQAAANFADDFALLSAKDASQKHGVSFADLHDAVE